MATLRLGAISFDCADPTPLGAFWATLLGGEVIVTRDDLSVVKLPDGLLLTAMRVDDHQPPTWPSGLLPKQAHVDVAVDDLVGAEQRALALGATRAAIQPDPPSHTVMVDPAGHPFCLSKAENFPT